MKGGSGGRAEGRGGTGRSARLRGGRREEPELPAEGGGGCAARRKALKLLSSAGPRVQREKSVGRIPGRDFCIALCHLCGEILSSCTAFVQSHRANPLAKT